ncbi:unnamed protein product [Menidia menidia]|uniref:(Atlantic silverside) hypothetical protein n=1 Tax=Menidia menidia TaxID=238744 RepID=A0A8S4APD6_9TELE|nr:unnamed protein product [Menidia menidia]
MRLNWDAAPGAVRKYIVTYKPEEGDLKEVEVEGDVTTLGLTRLISQTEYDVAVTPVYDAGPANPMLGTAITDVVPAPKSLRFSEVAQTSFRASWEHGAPDVALYRIGWARRGQTDFQFVENSQGNSDYINASPIMDHDPRNPAYIATQGPLPSTVADFWQMDHDPRNPAYIATQGPLPSTVADFWQMVWENGCVVVVMLTPLVESGVKQCYHYWPDEGSNLYHIYEVNLVSEHIWCDDFLVRSFYLKNMQTNETRTVTQFHFLTWLNQNVPETSRTLLDFRSDGSGRTGTYILIDMVLNKMAKGAKEIDIAATLEHLRDQRPGMVQTKDQFEFALTTVAEEVNAILKVLPQ